MSGFLSRQVRKVNNLGGDALNATGKLWNDVTGVTAAQGAADAQQNAANSAQASQERMFNQSLDTQKPWLEAGGRGLSQLESGINSGAFNTQQGQYTPPAFQDLKFDFEADPGYQFRLSEGNKAVQASAAARGGLFSGKTGTDLQDYAQGQASQEYGAAYGRFADQRDYNRQNFQNDRNFSYGQFGDNFNRDRAVKTDQYNRLASLAGVGQTAAGNVSNMQMDEGGNLANLAMQRGNIAAQRSQAGYQGPMNLFNTALQGGSLALSAFGPKGPFGSQK